MKELMKKLSRSRRASVGYLPNLSRDCSQQVVLVSLTTSITHSSTSFTSVQIASRMEEALAHSGFANLARCQFGLTPYKIAAEPKLRIPPYITMLNVSKMPTCETQRRALWCLLTAPTCYLPGEFIQCEMAMHPAAPGRASRDPNHN